MAKQQKKIKFGEVDLTKPHLLITRSKAQDSKWEPIAVLSIAESVEDMRLALLVHDGEEDWPWVEKMHQKLNYYLFELKESVWYLIYHASSMSNVYDEIHLTYIDRITSENIFYFIKTQSKLIYIHDNISVSNLEEFYFKIMIDDLFDKALEKNKNYLIADYNTNLNFLYDLIYREIPLYNNFNIDLSVPLPKFLMLIKHIYINSFCNLVNYLKKCKLVTASKSKQFVEFYYLNQKYNDMVSSSS